MKGFDFLDHLSTFQVFIYFNKYLFLILLIFLKITLIIQQLINNITLLVQIVSVVILFENNDGSLFLQVTKQQNMKTEKHT